MRSIWKGAISFGLVSIPIKLYAATESKDVHFHYLHKADGSRIEYRKVCAEEEREVANDELVRGYEYAKGQYVTVEEDDVERIPLASGHAIEITEFVDLPKVDPIYFEKTYYLEPQEGAGKPYSLLKRAMAQANKIALAKIVLRDKEHLALVRCVGDVLALETLFYPDEIRDSSQLEGIQADVAVSDKEMAMAVNLIEALAGEFEPEKYKDNYREALLEVINQKIQGTPLEETPQAKPSTRVMDLMEALRASVEMAKGAPEERSKVA
ncbi:MAG TPA: Ku protein [Chloroflexota bacterium]|nr:Ku protein [Chloroflexota bacterium]